MPKGDNPTTKAIPHKSTARFAKAPIAIRRNELTDKFVTPDD